MPDIRPPHQPSPSAASPPPSSYGDVTKSWWKSLSRLQRNRLIGAGVLVVLIGGGVVLNHLNKSPAQITGGTSSTQNGGATTNSPKADQFSYDGVTYGVDFTGVDLNGQTAQSATGLDVKYTLTILSEPANLDRTPDSFIINAAVPKSETPQCGVVPTPDPTNPIAGVGTYFMPVAQKTGWCQLLDGLNNANNEGEQADDPNAPNYSTTPQEIDLTDLIPPVDRSKVVLVVSPVDLPNHPWIIPYNGN